MSKEKICFVITPIGDEGSEIRLRADNIFEYVIKQVVEPLGYTPLRSDKISKSGMITPQIIEQIVSAPLIIADLTDHNPNVSYELALRHAIKKPCIHIMQVGQPLPFDIGQQRTIFVDEKNLHSVDKGKKDIAAQVKEVDSEAFEMETPISTSIFLETLKKSGGSAEQSMAELMKVVLGLQDRMYSIETMLDDIVSAKETKRTPSLADAFTSDREFYENYKKLNTYFGWLDKKANEAKKSTEEAKKKKRKNKNTKQK